MLFSEMVPAVQVMGVGSVQPLPSDETEMEGLFRVLAMWNAAPLPMNREHFQKRLTKHFSKDEKDQLISIFAHYRRVLNNGMAVHVHLTFHRDRRIVYWNLSFGSERGLHPVLCATSEQRDQILDMLTLCGGGTVSESGGFTAFEHF